MIEPITIAIAVLAIGITVTVLSFYFFRNKRKEIALAIFSLFFFVLIAELFFRLFVPQLKENMAMFKYDPVLGWTFIPNKRGSIVYLGEVGRYIETNSLGFRDNALPSDTAGMRKILVLGDSFVSNIGVSDDDVFTEVMEQQLKNTLVLNFGVNGYGQVQEYLLEKEWLDKLNPDLVVLVIYLRNDFQDNIGTEYVYPRPIASWSDEDSLRILPPPAFTAKDTPHTSFWHSLEHLHIYALFERIVRGVELRLRVGMEKHSLEHNPSAYTPPELFLCRKQQSENARLMDRTMEELLLRIARFADKRKTPLVFALAPSVFQVDDELWSSLLKEYRAKSEDYSSSLPNEKLMKFAEQNDLLMIDLLPLLRAEREKENILYNHHEQHWNSDGNRFVAHALLDYLNARSLINPIQK